MILFRKTADMRSARAGSIGLHVGWLWGGTTSSLFDRYARVPPLDVIFLVCLTPNQLKVTEMTPKWVRRGTQNAPKNQIKSRSGLPGDPWGVPKDPWVALSVPQSAQNGASRPQMTTLGKKTDPIQQAPSPACLQVLPVLPVTS